MASEDDSISKTGSIKSDNSPPESDIKKNVEAYQFLDSIPNIASEDTTDVWQIPKRRCLPAIFSRPISIKPASPSWSKDPQITIGPQGLQGETGPRGES